MHSVGIDIIEISRIEEAINCWGERFLRRIYTKKEIELCQNRFNALATYFAGKEAVMKVLGMGISWQEIEILADPRGKPSVYLHNKAKSRAEELGLKELAISLSHSRDYAIASVVGELNIP